MKVLTVLEKLMIRRWILLAGCLFYSYSALPAVIPESGFWHVEGWRGLGFSIEKQNDRLFVVTYAYDAAGNPLFYTSTGTIDPSTDTFKSTLDFWENGYCLNCGYAPADNQGSVGDITIKFLSPSTATVSWPGAKLNIQRFLFGGAPSAGASTYGSLEIAGSKAVPGTFTPDSKPYAAAAGGDSLHAIWESEPLFLEFFDYGFDYKTVHFSLRDEPVMYRCDSYAIGDCSGAKVDFSAQTVTFTNVKIVGAGTTLTLNGTLKFEL